LPAGAKGGSLAGTDLRRRQRHCAENPHPGPLLFKEREKISGATEKFRLTFAQFERELASERVKDKVIQRVNRGLYHGGHPPYGYKSENKALVPDPPRDGHIKLIFETHGHQVNQR
jgi:hypothetical protein